LATITYFLLRSGTAHEKLKEEIRGRFKGSEELNIISVSKLPYLHAVIEEGMRIVPTASVGFSRISPGTTVDGCYVPTGVSNTIIPLKPPKLIQSNFLQTEIYVSSWTVARDSRYFHDPLAFKPERWLDQQCADVKEASQPFSLGPRSCPGKAYVCLVPLHHV